MLQLPRLKSLRFGLIAAIASILTATAPLVAQTLSLPEDLFALDSETGETLLFDSDAREDYLPLSAQFVTQDNLAYCGVASMVMVLNALDIDAPAAGYETFHFFTQQNFFDNPLTQAVLSPEVVRRQGMTLEELGGLLASYPVRVEVYHGGEVTLEEFRAQVVENLRQPHNYVLVNYLRRSIGQERGGHISPIAAYHAASDRFLILDVARYKYPPIWVRAEDLWNAMNTIDSVSNQTRGFILVSPSTRAEN